MRILVTGATGFLGKFLCPFLEGKGHEVFPLSSASCDLTEAGALSAAAKKERFDQIFHLAAWTQAGDFCLRHPGEQWIINQKINTHVLDWWQREQRQATLIAMGTSCSYDPELPLKEELYLRGEPIESLFSYAMTKRMLFAGLLALQKQYQMRYFCFVPSTLYGEGYHTDGRQMHFIFDLIRKILRGKLYGEPVVLWGDGHQKREVIHVRDFLKAMDVCMEKSENALFNIGSGQEFSIRAFAEVICKEVGYPFEKIVFDTSRYVGAKSKVLSIEKLKALYPEFSPTPLTEGVRGVVQWFQEEQCALSSR